MREKLPLWLERPHQTNVVELGLALKLGPSAWDAGRELWRAVPLSVEIIAEHGQEAQEAVGTMQADHVL